jgi:ribosomal protein L21E
MTETAPDLTPPTKAAKAPKVPKEPKVAKEPKAPKEPKISRFKALYPDEAPITVLVEGNPKRGKSKERFEGYTGSATVGEAVAKGVLRADIAWDVGHGLIKVG